MKTIFVILYQDENSIGIHYKAYDNIEQADEQVILFKEQDKEENEHYYYEIFKIEVE